MAAGSPRILVLKPSSLGDIVHTLPAVAAIRAHWPESEISWLVNPEWAPLLAENTDVDRIVEFPRKRFRGLRGLLKVPAWLASVGRSTPDLALDFQGLLRMALIARFVGAQKIIGLSDAREGAGFFYHQRVALPREPMHAVDRYLKMAQALGVGDIGKPVFKLPVGTKPRVDLPEHFILLHPFSRGEGKSLETGDVIKLCRHLEPHPVVLVGSAKAMPDLPPNVYNFLGQTTLQELTWLIRRADFTISVDSGPMHMVAAITYRLLSIHTWSDPLLVGPYNRAAWIWKNGAISQMADYRPSSVGKLAAPNPQVIAEFVLSKLSQ